MPSTISSPEEPKKRDYKKFAKPKQYSRNQLTVFALVFALIGGFLLWKAFAAEPLVASLQAEQMTMPHWGYTRSDSSANGGKMAVLYANGTATGSVTLTANATSVKVVAKGTSCNNDWPVMTVTLDDVIVLNTKVSSTNWKEYSAAVSGLKGTHRMSINFSNDFWQRYHCDRNLYLDVSNFFGPAAVPNPAPTVSINSSPTTVTAGGSATLAWTSVNATACTASGAWSGTKSLSGNVSTGALNSTSTYNLSCTGTGGTTTASTMVTVTPGTTTPPPPPPTTPPPTTTPPPASGSTITCTKTTTTSGGSLQTFVDGLSSGQTGCLRAGTYNLSGTLYYKKGGVTLASYPGERAIINGYSEVSRGADGVKLANLSLTVTGNAHTMRIYGNNTIIEGNDITDNHQPGAGACISVGGSQDRPSGVIIRRNIIHNCGNSSDNQNHGIYANSFTDLTIVDNIFYMTGAYSIQLYPDGTRATVSHNVIDGSNEYSIRGGIIIDGTTAVNHTIEYNIIVNAATAGITTRTGSGHVARNNCFYNNKGGDISGTITQSGNSNANPNFVNKAARNYQLASGSQCLNIVGYDTAKKLAGM